MSDQLELGAEEAVASGSQARVLAGTARCGSSRRRRRRTSREPVQAIAALLVRVPHDLLPRPHRGLRTGIAPQAESRSGTAVRPGAVAARGERPVGELRGTWLMVTLNQITAVQCASPQ